jgi:hypothetical protein
MDNVTIESDATFSTGYGFQWFNSSANGSNGWFVTLNNCTIAGTIASIRSGQGRNNYVYLNNTSLTGATEFTGFPQLLNGFIKSSKHDQTEGAFKSWFNSGVIERDSVIFNTAAPSERLSPVNASLKLQSGPRLVAVDDGSAVTINVYVRKSVAGDGAAYNGNQPRLIVKKNLAAGITSDTVLDTMTAAAGSWEQLTGTTAAVNADGALEFVVDCDGTAGWVNVDDWSVS